MFLFLVQAYNGRAGPRIHPSNPLIQEVRLTRGRRRDESQTDSPVESVSSAEREPKPICVICDAEVDLNGSHKSWVYMRAQDAYYHRRCFNQQPSWPVCPGCGEDVDITTEEVKKTNKHTWHARCFERQWQDPDDMEWPDCHTCGETMDEQNMHGWSQSNSKKWYCRACRAEQQGE